LVGGFKPFGPSATLIPGPTVPTLIRNRAVGAQRRRVGIVSPRYSGRQLALLDGAIDFALEIDFGKRLCNPSGSRMASARVGSRAISSCASYPRGNLGW